jgi:hypothetical protein
MPPGELIFHFLNTVVLTALVASVVLWRYRVDVLAGMGSSSGQALGIPAISPARTVTPSPPVDAQAWERQARWRIGLAYLGSVALPALLLAVLQLHVSDLPLTPAHVMLVGGSLLLAAVPMIAASLALRFRRAVLLALGVLLIACAVLGTGLSMLQRPFMGGRPSLDQLLNFFTFFQFAAVWLPLPPDPDPPHRATRASAAWPPSPSPACCCSGLLPCLARGRRHGWPPHRTAAASCWISASTRSSWSSPSRPPCWGGGACRGWPAPIRPSASPMPSCWPAPGGCCFALRSRWS